MIKLYLRSIVIWINQIFLQTNDANITIPVFAIHTHEMWLSTFSIARLNAITEDTYISHADRFD